MSNQQNQNNTSLVWEVYFSMMSISITYPSTKWTDRAKSTWQRCEFVAISIWKSVKFSAKTGPNYDGFKSAIEKISQTGKRWRYLHQTDFANRIPRSHKNTQFGGVLWGQFALANGRTEQPGRGETDHAYNSCTCPSRAGRQFLLAYQNQW